MPLITALSKIIVGLLVLVSVNTLAEEGSPAGSQIRKEQEKSEAEIKIIVMGDSLSAAYYIPLESGWVHLLNQRLQAQTDMSVKLINSSISGATTAAGLQTLPAVIRKEKPQIVILELGGNDGLQGKPLSLISHNLEKLIALMLADNVKVLLIGMRLPPNLGSRYTEPFYQQYIQLAEKYQLPFVPFLLEGIAGNAQLMQEDGIHPTEKAQPLILENIWPTLEKLLRDDFK